MFINIEKISLCEGIKVQLPEHVFEAFTQNVCEYFSILENNVNTIRVDGAADIISALVAFREYFDSESDWESITLYALDIIRKGINRSHFDKISAFAGMTRIAFSLHELSEETPKIEPFFQGANELLLGNLHDYLEESDRKEFYSGGNYEAIMGLSGPLRYLLNFSEDKRMKDMAEKIIDVFVKRSKDGSVLGKRTPGWHYYPSEYEEVNMPTKAPNGVVNYGVSHGMGGPLVTLSIAYHKGFRVEGLLEAINGLVSEYMNALYYVDDIAYFPGRITFEQFIGDEEITKVPTQMSWCYGPAGILRALYISGDLLSNEDVKKFALDEFLKVAKMDLYRFQLMQPIVCHGYIGTAAILNLMYLDTNRIEFLHKAIEMVEASMNFNIERFAENERQVVTKRKTPPLWTVHDYLEGYNGIIQTALSIIKGKSAKNEMRLLMI